MSKRILLLYELLDLKEGLLVVEWREWLVGWR